MGTDPEKQHRAAGQQPQAITASPGRHSFPRPSRLPQAVTASPGHHSLPRPSRFPQAVTASPGHHSFPGPTRLPQAVTDSSGHAELIPSGNCGKSPSTSKGESSEFRVQCSQVYQGLPTCPHSNFRVAFLPLNAFTVTTAALGG